MKKRYKFLIGNIIYLLFYGILIAYNYNSYGWNDDWIYPASVSFTLGLFMFNIIPIIVIMLSSDIGETER